MGNNISSNNFKDSKPISAFFNEKTVNSTVITRDGFFFFSEKTREHLKNSLSKRPINIVVYDEDNNTFVTAEDDFFIRIYSGESGQFIRALPNLQSNLTSDVISISHQDFIRALYLITPINSNNTQYKTGEDMLLLSGSMDGTVRLWDIDSGNLLAIYMAEDQINRSLNKLLDTLSAGITALTFDSIHSYVISGSADGVIRKYSFIERNVLGTFDGHSRGAILNLIVTRQGHLISSSMDRTIRLWDIESGKQINGCLFFAQTIVYDKYRDIIFAASDNGSIALIQVVKETDWVLKKIKVLDLKKPAIIHLHYNTYSDLLTVTSIETNIASVQNATGIPFDVVQAEFKNRVNLVQGFWNDSNRNTLQSSISRSQSNYSISRSQSSMLLNNSSNMIQPPPSSQQQQQQQHEEIEDYIFSNEISSDLTDDIVNLSIIELKSIKELNNYQPSPNESNQDQLLNKLETLKKLGNGLFDSQINNGEDSNTIKIRKEKYASELKQFVDSVEEITEDYKSCMRMLISTRDAEIVLDTDNCKQSKQEELEKKRNEILERHKRELEEFESYSNAQLRLFKEDLPILNRKVANEYVENKKRLVHSQQSVDQSIQTYLSNTFPAISNRYHLGTLISEVSTTIFCGFDCQELRPVAVKVLPPGIKLNIPVHNNLTQVYEINETPQSIYVIMEPSETSLKPFIQSFNDQHQLPIDIVRNIMKQLLDTLQFLHSSSLVYRDLNPSRVLISGSGESIKVTLTHLGIMRSLQGTFESEPAEDGMIYGAPEIFGRVINTESDIWSLGCIFIYLLQNKNERLKPLFNGDSSKTLIENIIKVIGKPHQKDIDRMVNNGNMQNDSIQLLQFALQLQVSSQDPISNLRVNCSNATDSALDLLEQMLTFIPDKRISIQDALNHPFITNQSFTFKEKQLKLQQEFNLDSSEQKEELLIVETKPVDIKFEEKLEEESNSTELNNKEESSSIEPKSEQVKLEELSFNESKPDVIFEEQVEESNSTMSNNEESQIIDTKPVEQLNIVNEQDQESVNVEIKSEEQVDHSNSTEPNFIESNSEESPSVVESNNEESPSIEIKPEVKLEEQLEEESNSEESLSIETKEEVKLQEQLEDSNTAQSIEESPAVESNINESIKESPSVESKPEEEEEVKLEESNSTESNVIELPSVEAKSEEVKLEEQEEPNSTESNIIESNNEESPVVVESDIEHSYVHESPVVEDKMDLNIEQDQSNSKDVNNEIVNDEQISSSESKEAEGISSESLENNSSNNNNNNNNNIRDGNNQHKENQFADEYIEEEIEIEIEEEVEEEVEVEEEL